MIEEARVDEGMAGRVFDAIEGEQSLNRLENGGGSGAMRRKLLERGSLRSEMGLRQEVAVSEGVIYQREGRIGDGLVVS